MTMARNEAGHRGDEITAYLSEALEPEEKAAFEAHLATCEECQSEVAAQRALFDQVNKALVFKRKRSIDEQVARFESEVAAERAQESARAPVRSRRYPRWAIPAAVALAAGAAAVFVLLGRPGGGGGPDTMAQKGKDGGGRGGMMSAPHPLVQSDGGVDAGPDDAAVGN
jgi:anti-sigma factor RsiW